MNVDQMRKRLKVQLTAIRMRKVDVGVVQGVWVPYWPRYKRNARGQTIKSEPLVACIDCYRGEHEGGCRP